MENTLFSGLVDKFFRAVVGKITEKYNDKSKDRPEADVLFCFIANSPLFSAVKLAIQR